MISETLKLVIWVNNCFMPLFLSFVVSFFFYNRTRLNIQLAEYTVIPMMSNIKQSRALVGSRVGMKTRTVLKSDKSRLLAERWSTTDSKDQGFGRGSHGLPEELLSAYY
jgi:hypothetical protein